MQAARKCLGRLQERTVFASDIPSLLVNATNEDGI